MKKSIIIIIACLTLGLGFAQEFKIETSKSFTKENEKEVYKIVFPSAYGFMTLHHLDNVMMDNTKAVVLTKYDQSMASIETKTFNLPKLGLRASDLQEVIELEDELIFLSTVMDKKTAKHQLNVQVYSLKYNTVSDNRILASFPINGYSKSGFYQIAISPDNSKIAIVANMPFVKKTQEKVKVWVYNTQLNLIWEQQETLVYDSERAYNETVFLQNSGVVIMHKTTNAYKKTRQSELLTFNGSSLTTKAFSSEGFMPMQMDLIDVNGKNRLAGFFWNGKKAVVKINNKEGQDNDGVFLYDLDAGNLIGFHEWSQTLNAKDLKSLKVVDVIINEDDIFILGEKYLYDSEFRKVGGKPSMDLDYLYTYGSSIIVNLDTKGTLKSFTPLFNSKTFKNTQKEKGSFSALYLENGLRIFANNNNNNSLSFNTFFTKNKETFNYPRVTQSTMIPYILPNTVTAVKDYGMVYYITNYGDRYWFNKMTW